MLKIICPQCDNEILFQTRNNLPAECSFCCNNIPENTPIIEQKESREISGLTLIYQKTNERIEIGVEGKVLLGRNHMGKEIFSKILTWNGKEMAPVISRKHCSITFNEGCFQVLDEGSTNGTFYSINKHSCRSSPQVIEDKSILFIGQEEFLAIINYLEQTKIAEPKNKTDLDEVKKVKCYKCKKCGNESESLTIKCSSCGFKNTLIEVYE